MIYGKDSIQRLIVTPGSENANGDYIPGTEEWGMPMPCDAEPTAGKADTITDDNGNRSTYRYAVTLDVHVQAFKYGERVRITIDNEAREYSVKGFHRYAFMAKLWV